MNRGTAIVYPQMTQMTQMGRCLEASKTNRQSHPLGELGLAGTRSIICHLRIELGFEE